MVSLLGRETFVGFPSLTAEQQRARMERFESYESSLIAHVNKTAQEAARAVVRAEAQSAAPTQVSYTPRPESSKAVKVSVPTFDGKEADSLVFCIREIEIALSAGQIHDARSQVAFALSNLGGRARAWAMAKEKATPVYFVSWEFMAQGMRHTFLLANVAYRHRSFLLRSKQDKRSLQDCVMELQNLEAAMAGAPLSEEVKVTVFMGGVRVGPVRTELIRRQATTFNKAVHIALLEDHCMRSAQGHVGATEASEGSTPMDLSSAEKTRPRWCASRAGGRCFGCNAVGHYRRDCPNNP
uniref:CCHC-type domain-containing protein n=1 Tax=Hyaloperonospora arabidopsidis (strain Emoy2) TaxID=559515 RepID=M4C4R1_HYAAE